MTDLESFSKLEISVGIILDCLILFQVFCGVIVISTSIFGNKKILKSDKFLLLLLVNDSLGCCVAVIPAVVTYIANSWLFGEIYCWLLPHLFTIFLVNGLFQQAFLSIQRYFVITRNRKDLLSQQWLLIFNIASLVITLGIAAPRFEILSEGPLLDTLRNSTQDNYTSVSCVLIWQAKTNYRTVTSIFGVGCPMIISTISYVKIFLKYRSSQNTLQGYVSNVIWLTVSIKGIFPI